MGPANANIIYHSGTNPLSKASQLVWWGLLVTETLLLIRFFLELFNAGSANIFVSFVSEVTHFIIYPFTLALASSARGEGFIEWIIMIAAIAYFVLAIAIAKVLEVIIPIRTKIEYARTISRKKYSR